MATGRESAAARDLYLDLLARVLTRSIEETELRPARQVPFGPVVMSTVRLVQRALRRQQLMLVRREPVDMAVRGVGRDWPSTAETMVGLDRLKNVRLCVETALAEGVPGDLVETGVWRGGTVIYMRAILAAHDDRARRVWVCDSFQGLPAPDPRFAKDEDDTHWTFDELAVSRTQVEANFRRYRLLDEQVQFLEGWFADTLPDAPIDAIAVLRLDGDLYQSTWEGLTNLYPRVSPGGFVIVDDYGAIPGCRDAVHDYREQQGITAEIHKVDWTAVYWQV